MEAMKNRTYLEQTFSGGEVGGGRREFQNNFCDLIKSLSYSVYIKVL